MGIVDFFGVSLSTEVFVALIGDIVVAGLLIIAIVMAATHRGRNHHYIILVAFLSDELIFKALMYSRLSLGVFGSFPYSDAGSMAPVHLLLAALTTVLGALNVVLGFRYRTKKEGKMLMPPTGKKWHRLVGLLYVVVWFITFFEGMYIFSSFYL